MASRGRHSCRWRSRATFRKSGWTGFLKGLLDLAEEFKVPLAGGDTAAVGSGGIQADIVVVGSVPKGKAVLRSGAKPGEQIYVTGELGGSAAALARLAESKPVGAEYSRLLSSASAGCGGPVAAPTQGGFGHDRFERRAFHRSRTYLRGKPRGRGDRGGGDSAVAGWAGERSGSRSSWPCTAATIMNCCLLPPRRFPRKWREFESRGSGGPRAPRECG